VDVAVEVLVPVTVAVLVLVAVGVAVAVFVAVAVAVSVAVGVSVAVDVAVAVSVAVGVDVAVAVSVAVPVAVAVSVAVPVSVAVAVAVAVAVSVGARTLISPMAPAVEPPSKVIVPVVFICRPAVTPVTWTRTRQKPAAATDGAASQHDARRAGGRPRQRSVAGVLGVGRGGDNEARGKIVREAEAGEGGGA
jgi:hypothetical protein